jgi:hypothetical protein
MIDRDFDWSFINENSDTYVVHKLVPSLIPELKELMKSRFKNQWTALMVRLYTKPCISSHDLFFLLCGRYGDDIF